MRLPRWLTATSCLALVLSGRSLWPDGTWGRPLWPAEVWGRPLWAAGQTPAPPAQLPPLGHGLTAAEKATLQAKVDELGLKVAALKRQYQFRDNPRAPMPDRIADVEVYLDAVRRPLKYDERLYAPKNSTPLDYALQTIATGIDRANLLAKGQTPWMMQSGVRGFYSRIDGSAQPYIL